MVAKRKNLQLGEEPAVEEVGVVLQIELEAAVGLEIHTGPFAQTELVLEAVAVEVVAELVLEAVAELMVGVVLLEVLPGFEFVFVVPVTGSSMKTMVALCALVCKPLVVQ
jgi:hypothetical protein